MNCIVSVGVAEGLHPRQQRVRRRSRAAGREGGRSFSSIRWLREPLGVGPAAWRRRCFSSSSGISRPCSKSTRNMRPGCRRPLSFTIFGSTRQHADLAGHDHAVVVRQVIAAGAQAVAVEHRADVVAVGEDDRRRAVPRLHQAASGTRRTPACTRASISWFCHASGIIIITASGSERPPSSSSSSTLSKMPESLVSQAR